MEPLAPIRWRQDHLGAGEQSGPLEVRGQTQPATNDARFTGQENIVKDVDRIVGRDLDGHRGCGTCVTASGEVQRAWTGEGLDDK